MINLSPQKLKEILLKAGVIDEEVFEKFKNDAERTKQNLANLIISSGLINKNYFYTLLAQELNIELVSFDKELIDKNILHLLPEDIARSKRVIVFGKDEKGAYKVAMENPTDLETIDFLTLKLGGEIRPYLAKEEDLNIGYILYQEKITQDFKKIIEDSVKESLKSKALGGDIKELASELPIVSIVDNLISYAVSSRASDIHFEIFEDGMLVRFRIDGILHEILRIPKEIHPGIVARIKILSNLRVDEHMRPQDGRFRYKVGGEQVDIRVSVIPTFYGEKVELRLLPSTQKPLSFKELGMFDYTSQIVSEAIKKSYGMFLVCGPTGSGKTTTLYSILNILNRPEVNIVTIEDPIEYDMRYINQTQVNPAAGITFASGLRSILRQDPNIIMVGEIRDSETADIAVQAALTGHLVLASLHTNDSPTAIPRLVDMGIPPFLVSAVLNAVLSQRLVRKIHLNCIESYTPTEGELDNIRNQIKEMGLDPSAIRIPKLFYKGRGCASCNYTGYSGRMAIFEVLNVSENIRKLILSKDFNLDNVRHLAREEGMVTMFEDGLQKVELGLTTIHEVFRVMRE
jgi:type IV pilus assembly protein PilB